MEDTRIKVFVTGKTEAGKSILSKAIELGKEYHENPGRTIVLEVYNPAELDTNIKFQLYGAGGHSEYYLITTFFHHTNCIFLIVLGGTKEYSNDHFQEFIGAYLDIIVTNCKKGYIIIAISKNDDKEYKLNKSGINQSINQSIFISTNRHLRHYMSRS